METLIKVPNQLSINRDPHWVSTPREVGDGMEAQAQQSTTSILPASKSVSCTSTVSIARSRSPSPPRPAYHVIDEQRAFPDVGPLPSSISLTQSSVSLSGSEKFLIEEKSALKSHLEIQIQVNQEIKKLLVASVGDELGFHFERLSTEKSQLAAEVEELKAQIAAKKEELERLEISCDIWRSKFLASRMQCDDLSEWKRIHERHSLALGSAVRGLLREHSNRSEHLHQTLESLCLLDDKLNDSHCVDISGESSDAAEKCRRIVNSLAQVLLDPKDIPPRKRLQFTPNPTPAEKYILQILGDIKRLSSFGMESGKSLKQIREVRPGRGVLSHIHAYHGSLTLNCCSRCKGEIFVV